MNVETTSMQKNIAAILILGVLLTTPAWAQGDCKARLIEVDARLASSELGPTGAALKQMRDQAASMCTQGQDATAMQLLGMLEMSLPPTESELASARQADEDSKSLLTNDFLAGVWCSMTGEERSQLVFDVDGTYRFCLHDAVLGPYGSCSRKPESTADWLAKYPRAKTVEQNTIVIGGKRKNDYSTFKRGECKLHGR